MLEFLHLAPLWLILALYSALALALSALVWRFAKSWLRAFADRSPSEWREVLCGSLPRPLGASFFLLEVDFGLRWLPMPPQLELVTKHLLPFSIGILVILTLTRIARKAIDAYGRSNPALRSSAGIGHAITWVICLSAVALLASDALGISLAPALTALGVGSLAVALALQDTLSNFFSGVYLIADKPVRPGEFIRLEGGQEGYVESIGWRATHLRTLAGSTVIIPNATLAKGVITNFADANPRLVLELRVDVAVDADEDAVEKLLKDEAVAAQKVAGVKREPAPYVRFVPGFSRRALGFTLYVSLEPSADSSLVTSEVRKSILARLRRDRVPLPSAVAALSPSGPRAS